METHSKKKFPLYPAKHRQGFTFTSLLLLVGDFSIVTTSVLIPLLKERFEISFAAVALIQLSFYLAYLCSAPLATALVRRLGFQGAMRVSTIWGAISTLLGAVAAYTGCFVCFLPAVLLLGMTGAFIQIVGNAYVVHLGESQGQPRRLSMLHGIASFGMLLGPALVSLVLRTGWFPSSPPTICYLILSVLWCVIALLSLRIPNFHQPAQKEEDGLANWRDPNMWLSFFAIFFTAGGMIATDTFVIQKLSESMSIAIATLLGIFYWGGLCVGRLLCGSYLIPRFRARPVLFASLGLCLASLTVAILAKGFVCITALLLVGCFQSTLFPILLHMGSHAAETESPKVQGFLLMANIGGGIFPILQGLMADRFSVSASFAVPLLAMSLVLVLSVVTVRRVPAADQIADQEPVAA